MRSLNGIESEARAEVSMHVDGEGLRVVTGAALQGFEVFETYRRRRGAAHHPPQGDV